ncbi:MAG TPA: histidine phosphatase family protein [Candidatus Aquilonibacter sp.]|nr:histidine phosphatase family protein [Candidatus Aquilonibacter sp.]
MEITFVRHGQTEWNATRRYQGRSDIPLSDEGRAQAQALARALAPARFDAVFASDLQRAVETATIIAAPHGLAVQRDARIREFDFGAWEGLTWNEIVARWPEFRDQGATAAKLYQPQGGERFEDVCDRVASFLDDLRATRYEDVLAVTHAGVLHAVLEVLGSAIEDRPGDGLSVSFSQASVTRIAMNGEQARLITLNDVSHLSPTA